MAGGLDEESVSDIVGAYLFTCTGKDGVRNKFDTFSSVFALTRGLWITGTVLGWSLLSSTYKCLCDERGGVELFPATLVRIGYEEQVEVQVKKQEWRLQTHIGKHTFLAQFIYTNN